MEDNVMFKGNFNKITLGAKTKLEIELPEDTDIEDIVEIAKYRGTKGLIISFGDPQIKMSFPEFKQSRSSDTPQEGPRITGTIGPDGVVESVKEPEGEQLAIEDEEAEVTQEGYAADADEASADQIDADMDFEVEGSEPDADPADVDPESGDEVTYRLKVEDYILEEKPRFPEIAFDFPEILKERREGGKTWMDIAKEQGVTSSTLQSAFQKYKTLVSKQMGTAS